MYARVHYIYEYIIYVYVGINTNDINFIHVDCIFHCLISQKCSIVLSRYIKTRSFKNLVFIIFKPIIINFALKF